MSFPAITSYFDVDVLPQHSFDTSNGLSQVLSQSISYKYSALQKKSQQLHGYQHCSCTWTLILIIFFFWYSKN